MNSSGLTTAFIFKVWNMTHVADVRAVNAKNAEKSMSVSGSMESAMRSADDLRSEFSSLFGNGSSSASAVTHAILYLALN